MSLYSLPDDVLLHILKYVDADDILTLREFDTFERIFETYFIIPEKRIELLNGSTIDLSNKYELIEELKWIPISLYKPKINIVKIFKSCIHKLTCNKETYLDKDLIDGIPIVIDGSDFIDFITLSNCINITPINIIQLHNITITPIYNIQLCNSINIY